MCDRMVDGSRSDRLSCQDRRRDPPAATHKITTAGWSDAPAVAGRGIVMPFVFVLIGLGAGVLSGLFGIGGGIVIVPALLYFARFPMQQATGTSLGVFLLPVGILGALTYYR